MHWFSESLLTWYKRHKRDLPWRNTNDPYAIWLSEIILQQTQVAQGLAYYQRFISAFPTVKHLASASEDEVLKLWQGLGYYSRARNLHATAKMIMSDFQGVFPQLHPQILSLKGVGDYTAAAIASFAFNLPHAVVDGNVYRLLSRVFGIALPIDSSLGKKTFKELADELLDRKKPALHNQAIMEFGSQFCKPVNPDCPSCIFNSRCIARESGQVGLLPVKEKKTKVRNRYLHYLVLCDAKAQLMLHKRQEGDIWQGLYEFNLVEKESAKPLIKTEIEEALLQAGARKPVLMQVSDVYKHVLSHQHLFATFYVYRVMFKASVQHHLFTKKALEQIPFPRLIEKFTTDCELKEIL